MKKKVIALLSIIIVIFLFGSYCYYENTELVIKRYNVVNNKIPKAFHNYKIIQISDYHNTKSKRLNRDLINSIKKEKPNIIVITGDLVDATKTDIDTSINLIKELEVVAPIYYVKGNHEVKISNYDELRSKLLECNVNILENKGMIIEKDNDKINILGIDDPITNFEDYVSDANTVNNELQNIDYDSKLFSILLSHRPELFETYSLNNIDLVLTGHAHGGQIRIPFIGGLIAPNQGFLPKYDSGLFIKENTNMIVSRGIGNSVIPIRINNRPELTIINLKSY